MEAFIFIADLGYHKRQNVLNDLQFYSSSLAKASILEKTNLKILAITGFLQIPTTIQKAMHVIT